MSLIIARTSLSWSWVRSFLLAVEPEFLQIGPKISDVLVVLDADKCHAGARHRLHGGTNIRGEGLLAPCDAGIFIGLGVVVALERAGLAPINAVERRPELGLRFRTNVMTRQAQSPEYLLA